MQRCLMILLLHWHDPSYHFLTIQVNGSAGRAKSGGSPSSKLPTPFKIPHKACSSPKFTPSQTQHHQHFHDHGISIEISIFLE